MDNSDIRRVSMEFGSYVEEKSSHTFERQEIIPTMVTANRRSLRRRASPERLIRRIWTISGQYFV